MLDLMDRFVIKIKSLDSIFFYNFGTNADM